MSRVWRSRETHDYVIAAKGAPEAVTDLCHLDDGAMADVSRQVAATGLRGPARARCRARLVQARRASGRPARLRLRVPRPRRPRGSRPADGRRGGQGVPLGGDSRRDDHRGLPGDRAQHRSAGGAARGHGRHRPGAGRHGHGGAPGVRRAHQRVRARRTRAEAEARRGAQGQRRGGRHDRRRRERCARLEVRPHRHRHGWARDRRGARVGLAGAPGRRLHVHRAGGAARPPDLRQPEEGDGVHLRDPRADRRDVAHPRFLQVATRPACRFTSSFSS